jgi:hypothetical protein
VFLKSTIKICIGYCYSLDYKSPPKAYMLKAWSSACDATGRWCSLWEVRPTRRKLGQWGHALKGACGTLGTSCLSPCFLASMTWAAPSTMWSYHDVLPHHMPKARDQLTMEWNLSNCEPVTFSIYKQIVSLICHSNRKLTKTGISFQCTKLGEQKKVALIFHIWNSLSHCNLPVNSW